MSIGKTTVFKLFLFVGIIIISIVFVWYSLDVMAQLKADAERMAATYVRLWQLAASENSSGGEVQIIFDEVIKKANFPVIIGDLDDQPVFWRNVGGINENDRSGENLARLRKIMLDMKDDKGAIPLKFGNQTLSYFYYGDSRVIRQLQWMPFVELGLVAAFILVGFVGFQNIRRSEERHIWVGMAKETAHQLGTPISSLMGWLEILSSGETGSPGQGQTGAINYGETFDQMKTDITRLKRVANRFGQIGAKPDLHETDINNLMDETVAYYRRRLPFNGKGLEIGLSSGDVPAVSVNGELLAWVIENLIKNALQAVDPQSGRVDIKTALSKDNHFVIIEVIDNGKGISAGIARKIFRPGFTTKKRGWGLGLTLSRRIIEEYHKGKISLVKSRPGETVFQVVLPITGGLKVKRFRQYA